MTRILSIDLTSENGSLALVEDAQVLDEIAIQSKDGYGHVMFPPLDELLRRHQWTLDSIDCFDVAAANPFAAATPTRTPVNEPGPYATAKQSIESSVH